MENMTAAQRRKIFAVARELKLDDDLLHDVVYGLTRKEHISDLTKREAVLVIDDLERRVRRPQATAGRGGKRTVMATRKQLWMINKLVKDLGWDDNPKRLQGFIRKYAKVDHPRWLTLVQAGKIIEGLKALAERQEEQAAP